jgi:hypothetical protein
LAYFLAAGNTAESEGTAAKEIGFGVIPYDRRGRHFELGPPCWLAFISNG